MRSNKGARIALRIAVLEWQADGACADLPPLPDGRPASDLFFSFDPDEQAQARAVCYGCEVRAPCLAAAIRNREVGIWGGLDEDERNELRRRARERRLRHSATQPPAASSRERASWA